MLHLLTSQVGVCHKSTSKPFDDSQQKMDKGELGELHFNLDKDNSEWLKFCKFTYTIYLEQSNTEADEF